jgi:cold shock CspA family protein/ribosome-associated translation inhibitor RaiA
MTMKLPLQVTYRNMESSPMIEDWIREEASKLETFYDQIMGCRVALEVPHRHHRRGTPYHIRVDLTLPGKELVIKRMPSLIDRPRKGVEREMRKHLEVETPHRNLRLAIHDAFKAAGRRLQDFSRRQRGLVKTHEPLPVARVSRLLATEGYGFLTTPDGREVYFHKDSVLNQAFHRLKTGTLVSFAEERGNKGPQASTVRMLGKHSLRPEARRRVS